MVIYSSHQNIERLRYNLQSTIDRINEWYIRNRLILSTEKCTSMLINNSNRERRNKLELYLGSKCLAQVEYMKYLGLTIDTNLHWTDHIKQIAKKVNVNNYRLRKLGNIMPPNLKLKTHNVVFVPILDYASTVWGDFTRNETKLINRLVHMAARAISGKYDYVNCRGLDIMKQMDMPPFEYRLNYYKSIMMFKAVHDMVPDHISNNITSLKDITTRCLRDKHEHNLYIPKPNL